MNPKRLRGWGALSNLEGLDEDPFWDCRESRWKSSSYPEIWISENDSRLCKHFHQWTLARRLKCLRARRAPGCSTFHTLRGLRLWFALCASISKTIHPADARGSLWSAPNERQQPEDPRLFFILSTKKRPAEFIKPMRGGAV